MSQSRRAFLNSCLFLYLQAKTCCHDSFPVWRGVELFTLMSLGAKLMSDADSQGPEQTLLRRMVLKLTDPEEKGRK